MCSNSFCQVEDDSEVRAAEAEMDEVDAALGQLIGSSAMRAVVLSGGGRQRGQGCGGRDGRGRCGSGPVSAEVRRATQARRWWIASQQDAQQLQDEARLPLQLYAVFILLHPDFWETGGGRIPSPPFPSSHIHIHIYVGLYIQIYIAPKIVRTNLRRRY